MRPARRVTWRRFGTSFTAMTPRWTRTNVPSQRSAVSHLVPRTVADA